VEDGQARHELVQLVLTELALDGDDGKLARRDLGKLGEVDARLGLGLDRLDGLAQALALVVQRQRPRRRKGDRCGRWLQRASTRTEMATTLQQHHRRGHRTCRWRPVASCPISSSRSRSNQRRPTQLAPEHGQTSWGRYYGKYGRIFFTASLATFSFVKTNAGECWACWDGNEQGPASPALSLCLVYLKRAPAGRFGRGWQTECSRPRS